MLLWLSEWLANYFHVFHVFLYLTLRAILGTLTALVVALLLGQPLFVKLCLNHVGSSDSRRWSTKSFK